MKFLSRVASRAKDKVEEKIFIMPAMGLGSVLYQPIRFKAIRVLCLRITHGKKHCFEMRKLTSELELNKNQGVNLGITNRIAKIWLATIRIALTIAELRKI